MRITFKYIAIEDNTSIISILENIVDIDVAKITMDVLYEGVELNSGNYSLDIDNKQILLNGWNLNKGEEIIYKIYL